MGLWHKEGQGAKGTKLRTELILIMHTPLSVFVACHPMKSHNLWMTLFLFQDSFHFSSGGYVPTKSYKSLTGKCSIQCFDIFHCQPEDIHFIIVSGVCLFYWWVDWLIWESVFGCLVTCLIGWVWGDVFSWWVGFGGLFAYLFPWGFCITWAKSERIHLQC